MVLSQGEIILVTFPFTDLRSIKTRPALVLLTEAKELDIIIVPITSQRNSYKACKITSSDLVQGKLPVTSYIRYHKVATLHASLIRKRVGLLKVSVFKEVVGLFTKQFR